MTHSSPSTGNKTDRRSNELKMINIDFLYLDLSVCNRCQGTETSLEDSLQNISQDLSAQGYLVQLNKVHIETREQAIQHQFLSSPTIRINGQDVQLDVKEDHCSSCSSLTKGASVNCRLWLYQGKEYTVPPQPLIRDAISQQIKNLTISDKVNSDKFILSKNLEQYFDKIDNLCASKDKEDKTDKNQTTSACCQSDCCE